MNEEAFPTDVLFLLRAIVEENITLTRIKYILKIQNNNYIFITKSQYFMF